MNVHARLIRKEVVKLVLEDKVTWSEACLYALLEALNNGCGCTASNRYLAQHMGLTKGRIQQMLRKLSGIKLVRVKPNSKRRRRKVISRHFLPI